MPRVNDPSGLGWEQCTFEGSERAQLRVWAALPLRVKLEALEQMCDRGRRMVAWRRSQGLPYFDPDSGELIRGDGTVAETNGANRDALS